MYAKLRLNYEITFSFVVSPAFMMLMRNVILSGHPLIQIIMVKCY